MHPLIYDIVTRAKDIINSLTQEEVLSQLACGYCYCLLFSARVCAGVHGNQTGLRALFIVSSESLAANEQHG